MFHYNENIFSHLIALVSDSWRGLFPVHWKEIVRRKWVPVRLSLKTLASLLKWGLGGKLNQWFKEKEWKKLHMMCKLENTAITAVKIYDKLGYLFSLVAQSLKSEATCLLGKASECTLLVWMVDSYKKWNFVRFQKLQNQNVFRDIISNFNFWFFAYSCVLQSKTLFHRITAESVRQNLRPKMQFSGSTGHLKTDFSTFLYILWL